MDDTKRDLYWCVVLKFLSDLHRATPSDADMTAMLDRLESMCQKGEVLEGEVTKEEGREAGQTEDLSGAQADAG